MATPRHRLPLNDPRWWPLGKALAYFCIQMGSRDLADLDFPAAVNDGRLRCKIEQFNRRTGERQSTLLSAKLRRKYELGPYDYGAWAFRPRAADIPPVTPPYVLFLWRPDVLKIWPECSDTTSNRRERDDAPARPAPAPEPTPTLMPPPRKRGPRPHGDWKMLVALEFIRRLRAGEPEPTVQDVLELFANEHGWALDERNVQRLFRTLMN
jgi:hypothetical protein